MMKNVVDVVFGGLSYWLIGHGFSSGNFRNLANPFCGIGPPFVGEHYFDIVTETNTGYAYADFLFQLSFATTASTIVSGAMAERSRLSAYVFSSLCSTIIYSFPSHWLWSPNGFLHTLGVVDIAGAGGIHLCGGTMGLVATIFMGPRRGRFDDDKPWTMSCPTNVLLGTFILWWGALGLNAGSSQGLSGGRWAKAARSATATILSTIGGGVVCTIISRIRKKTFDIGCLVTGLLSALMAITAYGGWLGVSFIFLNHAPIFTQGQGMCSLAVTWHGFVIGACASALTAFVPELLVRLHIDDPINVIPVHFCGGIIGLLSSAFLLPPHIENLPSRTECHCLGLFYGGGFHLLGVQILAIVTIMAWSAVTSITCFFIIDKAIGLRLSEQEELAGADLVEHGLLYHSTHGKSSQINIRAPKETAVPPKKQLFEEVSIRNENSENNSAPSDPPASIERDRVFVIK